MKHVLASLLAVFILLSVSSCTKNTLSVVETYTPSDLDSSGEYIMVQYYKMSDGTWRTDSHSYRYRLEIIGRMGGAAYDTTFVFLSNRETISFERAWKASGLSSNSNDYFKEADAKFVGMGLKK